MGKILDLTNRRFGLLVVVRRVENSTTNKTRWLCLCDCGNEKVIRSFNLVTCNTKSCGCLNRRSGLNSPTWKGHGEISSHHWNLYKSRSFKRSKNILWDLTIEEGWSLFLKQNRRCALSGIELNFGSHKKKDNITASLDRIDSSKGYTIDNVQWVHKDINFMKNEYNEQYFIEMCKKVAKNAA